MRRPERLEGSLPAGALEVIVGSLTAPGTLTGLAAGMDGVAHLAGLVSARRAADYYLANQHGTAALACECAQAAPDARWIQVSSLAATGPGDWVRDSDVPRPVSHYGRSKLAGEEAVAASGLRNWIVLRPSAVYGPGDRAFLPFFRAAARGLPVLLPAGRLRRLSLVHVEDLARAIVAALEAPAHAARSVFHVAHPRPVAPEEFLGDAAAAAGGKARVLRVPAALPVALALACAPARWLTGRPRFLSPDKMREVLAPAWCCDPSRARAALGWEPAFDCARGVADTVRSYRREGWLPGAGGAGA